MDLLTLCEKIGMPQEVTGQVLAFPVISDDILVLLRTPGRWEEGKEALANVLEEDPDGLGTLAAHLQCALKARENHPFSEEIFLATMKCFTRFVEEHRVSYGYYGFDRAFWTVRQLSGVLWRIGELEYEIRDDGIHLHIPSDAILENARLRHSWEQARHLLGDAPMVCHSWLLSPDLQELLEEGSRILAFQRNFITYDPEPDESFRQWVFKDPYCPDRQLPEDTRLQRALKAHLLSGKIFHCARGTLSSDPFR